MQVGKKIFYIQTVRELGSTLMEELKRLMLMELQKRE